LSKSYVNTQVVRTVPCCPRSYGHEVLMHLSYAK